MNNQQLADSFTIEGEQYQLKARREDNGQWAGILYSPSCSVRCPNMLDDTMRTRAALAGAAQLISEFPEEDSGATFDAYHGAYDTLEEHYDSMAISIAALGNDS